MLLIGVGLKDLYGDPVSPLVVEISGQTAERLHVKIYDPNSKRWEIPTKYIVLLLFLVVVCIY